jgi:hypothetical protein
MSEERNNPYCYVRVYAVISVKATQPIASIDAQEIEEKWRRTLHVSARKEMGSVARVHPRGLEGH